MGLFKDALKSWFYTNNSQAANANARIPLVAGAAASGVQAGDPIGSDTLENIIKKQRLFSSSNVGIAASPKNAQGVISLLRTKDYDSTQYDPIGVWILEGGKLRIFSSSLQTSIYSSGTPSTSVSPRTSVGDAFGDFEGKTNTGALITSMGSDAYLAKMCADFEESNALHLEWWLPSMGEVGMLLAHCNEVVSAMDIISEGLGDTLLNGFIASSSLNNINRIYSCLLDGTSVGIGIYEETYIAIPVTTIEDDNI